MLLITPLRNEHHLDTQPHNKHIGIQRKTAQSISSLNAKSINYLEHPTQSIVYERKLNQQIIRKNTTIDQ